MGLYIYASRVGVAVHSASFSMLRVNEKQGRKSVFLAENEMRRSTLGCAKDYFFIRIDAFTCVGCSKTLQDLFVHEPFEVRSESNCCMTN